MATIGEQLLQPETGWQRIEDTNTLIKYDGNWTSYEHSSFSGNSAHYNNTKDFVSFIFYGSKLRIISEYFNNRDTNNLIIIDDVEYNFNCYSSTKESIVIAFEKLDLQKRCHTVKIANMNLGQYFLLDCIDIDEDGYLLTEEEYINMTTYRYLIQDNITSKIYSYDKENNNLVEINDISILKDDTQYDKCINDLNKVIDLIDLTD